MVVIRAAAARRFVVLLESLSLSHTRAYYYICLFGLQFTVSASVFIFTAAAVEGWLQFLIIAKIPIRSVSSSGESAPLSGSSNANDEERTQRLQEIYEAIYEGAESFLQAEYRVYHCL
mgnify:CR=1 FL=1